MLYEAYLLPWDRPKVIINASRLSQDGWSIAAGIDLCGLVCTQRFHGVWPLADMPVEVLAAILNGPIANAYIKFRRGAARDNQKRILSDIPIPSLTSAQITQICLHVLDYQQNRQQWLLHPDLAQQYEMACRQAQECIDADILSAYDLPPRLEREILDLFAGQRRPGPLTFDRFYPEDFKAAIPWKTYISAEFQKSSASQTLLRLPVFHDPIISELVDSLTNEEETVDD